MNMHHYCRLCAQLKLQDELTDLKSDTRKHNEIINKLIRLNCFFDYKDSVMPKTVCLLCIKILNQAFDFVEDFDRAQLVLKELILSRSIKDKVEDRDNGYSNDKFCSNEIKKECEIVMEFNSINPLVSKNKQVVENIDATHVCNLDVPLSDLNLTWCNYSWMCSYCGTQFSTVAELHKHSMEYHKTCNAYRCTVCNIRKMRLDSFLTHVRSHKEYLKMSCYKCFKVFSSTHDTHKHKIEHATSDFKCDGCNTFFGTIELLNDHVKVFYKNAHSSMLKQQPEIKSLACRICNKNYKTTSILSKHLLIHTERKRDYICEICGKCFLDNHGLVAHVELHGDIRPFQCEICKLSFKTQNHLRKHVGVHDGEKPFSCKQCGKCFRLQKHLQSHSIIHTELSPFVCSYCNKGFRFRSILIQHIRQHTGVKPYSCVICKREFTNWQNCNKHMKCRHKMDMAKKKLTSIGFCPIDPATGELIHPDINKVEEFKKKVFKKTKVSC